MKKSRNSTCTVSVKKRENEVAFEITIGRVLDQMVILKATLFFDGHLMYM
jgi:hypothetical protein